MCRAWIIFALLACGCEVEIPVQRGDASDVLYVSPGVGGSIGYEGLIRAVVLPKESAYVIGWGVPIFFLNFSDESVHTEAEQRLALEIETWHRTHPDARVDLIGHSAGGGVVLGAVARLKDFHVHNVILLAPSVSPGYDLGPALAHIDGKLHVFHSERDGLLAWRTSTFESYDRVKGAAAGVGGFHGSYPSDKLIQHAYDPQWNGLGNDGGHWGPVAEPFAKQVLAPLLAN